MHFFQISNFKQKTSLCILWQFSEQYFSPHLGHLYFENKPHIEQKFREGYLLRFVLILTKLGMIFSPSKLSSLINFFKLKFFLKVDSFFVLFLNFFFYFFNFFFLFFASSSGLSNSKSSRSSSSLSSANRFGES